LVARVECRDAADEGEIQRPVHGRRTVPESVMRWGIERYASSHNARADAAYWPLLPAGAPLTRSTAGRWCYPSAG